MKKEEIKYHKKGISLRLVTWIIAVFVFILSSALVTSLLLITKENNKVMQANTNYITIKQASNDVQLASDYLTDQVRLFVANGEKKYMDAYFFEAKTNQRREKALDTIHRLSEGTAKHAEIHDNITKAVNESKDLEKTEYFAMKLICDNKGIPYTYDEVRDADTSGVAPEDRQEVAIHAVLGTEYVDKKEIIIAHVDFAFELIDDLIRENSENSYRNLRTLIIYQTAIITANIIFAVAVVLAIIFMIIKPMNIALHQIERNDEIHSYGNREFNYIVDAYNDVRSQNEKVKERLTYEAEHDKLTNLYNRAGYVSLFRRMRLNKVIYSLVDADGFKEINDRCGHDIGDKVLIRIAETLEEYFTEENAFVFRIGGDEFAVIIEDANKEFNDNLVSRFEKINEELARPKGRIPGISLSVGIAHGEDDDSTDTLFKKADQALYKVKQSGKSGVYTNNILFKKTPIN